MGKKCGGSSEGLCEMLVFVSFGIVIAGDKPDQRLADMAIPKSLSSQPLLWGRPSLNSTGEVHEFVCPIRKIVRQAKSSNI